MTNAITQMTGHGRIGSPVFGALVLLLSPLLVSCGDSPEDAGGMCMDVTVYPDTDADGFGVEEDSEEMCLLAGEEAEGFARTAGDCEPTDPWVNEGRLGVCEDYVDDNCDGMDEACPTTNPADVEVPSWDCTGTAPANVYAHATFSTATGGIESGCFVFFEGLTDEFYVTQVGLGRTDPVCAESISGCTCPGSPSYDRRIYAFTRQDIADAECPEIVLQDQPGSDGGGSGDGSVNLEQPVSNECRKYLYQMHFYDMEYSYVGNLANLEDRVKLFPIVEITCTPIELIIGNISGTILMQTAIELNSTFEKQ